MKPRLRLGVTYIAEEERTVFESEHLLHCRDFWNWDDRFVFAIQIKAPDLRGAAEQIAYIKRVLARHDLLNNRFPCLNDLGRIFQFRYVDRQPQNFAAWRACS